MNDSLLPLVDLLDGAVDDFTSLARSLDDSEWELSTDLAGWSVHDQVSHVAHLEAVLAGAPEESIEVPEGQSHVRGLMNLYTEQGVLARRDRTRAELVEEIEASTARRVAALREHPPAEPDATADRTPGDVGWSWRTLLSNRPLDVVMHEQDIRRATGRPGNLDSPAIAHTVGVFGAGLAFVLGKRVGAEPGRSLAVELTDAAGGVPERFVVAVGDDGRGRPAPEAIPDATLRMSVEDFLVLAGGRREATAVEILGNDDLGRRVLENLAMTP